MENKYFKFLIVILAVAIVVPTIVLAAWWNPFSWGVWGQIANFFNFQKQEQITCTMEAKLCPDGSAVGREGPKCEFKECSELPVSPIKLISPNGGETWEVGKTYEIKWTVPDKPLIGFNGKPIDKINIEISRPPNEQYFSGGIAKDIPVSQGKFSFTVPSIITQSRFNFVTSSEYKISLWYLESEVDSSDANFSVIVPAPIVGGDKDSHGCIGSAGYSWCEVKQKCLRSWEETCENVGNSLPTSCAKNEEKVYDMASKGPTSCCLGFVLEPCVGICTPSILGKCVLP